MADVEQPESGEEESAIVQASGAFLAEATMTAEATIRRNFSMNHLRAAEHLAEELRRYEEEHIKAGTGGNFEYCTWYATAAIMLSFAAIEAAVDEAQDDLGVQPELRDALDRAATLDHAQALLAHRSRTTFDRGAEPYQSVELLRALRNALVHPKAEWDNTAERNRTLSKKIIGAHLPLSPFQPDTDLAFPHGCMSAGVATWAASSARKFIREFRARLSLE